MIGDSAQSWQLIVGFFLPLLVAAVVQTRWPPWAKAWGAFLACLVVALGTTYFAGQISQADVIGSVLTVFVVSISTYRGLWHPTGIAGAIERATDLTQSGDVSPALALNDERDRGP